MPESVYDNTRPLIELMQAVKSVPIDANQTTWTEAKNARRGALIYKEHQSKLAADEEQELASLEKEACRHQQRVAPLQNHILELIVEALERRVKDAHPPKS